MQVRGMRGRRKLDLTMLAHGWGRRVIDAYFEGGSP